MNITIRVSTYPESEDYIKIIHNERILSLNEFSESYYDEENLFSWSSVKKTDKLNVDFFNL